MSNETNRRAALRAEIERMTDSILAMQSSDDAGDDRAMFAMQDRRDATEKELAAMNGSST